MALLQQRGLRVLDPQFARSLLARVGYYHFSGYARYFQSDPAHGDNTFVSEATFEDIADLHALDSELRLLALSHLIRLERALRASFALRWGQLLDPYDGLLDAETFHSTGSSAPPVDQLVRRDLQRSKAAYVERHRGRPGRADYEDLPVWVAVEVMSFGTLSRCIEYVKDERVRHGMATDRQVANRGFSSAIRSFVALRNACAHLARLWNDVASNAPQVPNNIERRAKRRVGQFTAQSHLRVFVALDAFSEGLETGPSLLTRVEELMARNTTFARGIASPVKYNSAAP